MKHPNAYSLAKRLLDSRIRRNDMIGLNSTDPHRITDDEIAWAQNILATHLDACMRQGIRTDFIDAVEDSIDFALRQEKAYEPIPEGRQCHFAMFMMEEQDAD
jgi:hypothetical protein